MSKKLKPIVFHASFQEQQRYGQLHTLTMTPAERLNEMYRLNEKFYGKHDWKRPGITELHQGLPGESAKDFYARINAEL